MLTTAMEVLVLTGAALEVIWPTPVRDKEAEVEMQGTELPRNRSLPPDDSGLWAAVWPCPFRGG